MEEPSCKGQIFPTKHSHGLVESSYPSKTEADKESNKMEMALVCYTPPTDEKTSPDSGHAAGGKKVAGREDAITMYQPWSKLNESTNANGVLVGERVNLPKINLETNLLLESELESNQLEVSHGTLAVRDHLKPKNNILLLAHPYSADTLDSMVAQPLLAGGLPEADQMAVDLTTTALTAPASPSMALVEANPSP